MARNKSIIKNAWIDVAKRKHCCRRSHKHIIQAGELRLSVKEGRSTQNYCIACATATLEAGMQDIQKLQTELKK